MGKYNIPTLTDREHSFTMLAVSHDGKIIKEVKKFTYPYINGRTVASNRQQMASIINMWNKQQQIRQTEGQAPNLPLYIYTLD